jgi:hypothetical protein
MKSSTATPSDEVLRVGADFVGFGSARRTVNVSHE